MTRQSFVSLFTLLLLLAPASFARAQDDPKRIVLFDGKDTSAFLHKTGNPVQWKVTDDGAIEVAGGGDIVSKETFGDHRLHVEFMTPPMPGEVKGQARGNSGVYVQGRYEVQVLDSFGLEPGPGDCGAIYNIKPPDRNACKPPGEWQTYDITFRAPRWDEAIEKVRNARITVVHNGVTIHDDFELPSHTPGGVGGESPVPGPLLLQDHGNPVRFRNIWVEAIRAGARQEEVEPAPAASQSAYRPQKFEGLEPGLVGAYFRDVESLDALAEVKQPPFLVRVDPQLQFPNVHGQFYDTKLNNNFAARWKGVLRIIEAGTYELGLYSDDKSRLYIGDDLVIDNTKAGSDDDSKKLYLAAGDYPIRIEYHQGGGSARMHFSWKPGGLEDWKDIPQKQLLHVPADAQIPWDERAWAEAVWDEKAWLRDHAPKFIKMDYGPFVAHTFKINDEQTVNKGIAIKVGTEEDEAAVLFDTELLRYAAGWTDGFIKYHGVAFDGAHGPSPSVEGEVEFLAPLQSGCGTSTDFTDPRPEGLGNLPRQRGHFKGLYRGGDKVVLKYTIGDRVVHEVPSFSRASDGTLRFLRTIEVGPSNTPVWLNLTTTTDGGKDRSVEIPPSTTTTLLTVDIIAGTANISESDQALHPSRHRAGGAPRWAGKITTKGTLGEAEGAYTVDTVEVPDENPWHAWMRFGGLDFFSDGRAAVCTWSGDVWVVSGLDEKLEKVTWQRIAAGMFQPLGLKIVDDQIYVLGRDQITRLHDLNGDGEADFYENFNNDCIVSDSFHEFALDLQTDREGNFYFAKGGPVRPGGRGWQTITDHNGCVLKVSKDGSKLEVFATGVRAPNGMGMGPDGEISVGDNEGTWTPTCRLSFVEAGDFLGVVDLAHSASRPTDYKPPICWLPHKTVDNSSGGQVWAGEKWGPLSNRMLHMSYGQCTLFLVMTDEVDGVTQGGVVKFPLDFDTGICRGRVNPVDGQVWLTGLKGWQTRGAKDGALHRVRYTGKPLHMPTSLKVGRDTVTIGFDCELDTELATDPDSYAVEQWNYLWTDDYGSPEVSVDDPTKRQHDEVEVESATLSEDGKTVTLKIPGLRPVMQMKIQVKLETPDFHPVEYEIYNTINKVPGYVAPPSTQPTPTAAGS